MGIVRTTITLKNGYDLLKAKDGLIKEPEIRQTTVNAIVDTGAWTMVINEETRKKLGLSILRTDSGTLADGKSTTYNIAGPLEVTWEDRGLMCDALVLPDAQDILLGAIQLEAMDLIINPREEKVEGAHGDQVMHLILSCRKKHDQAAQAA
jgi:clan AA aspartic protease